MSINTATIQHRRGSLEDFNPEKMVPGELAFTTDGSRKVFAAFAPGDYKELASTEEVKEITEEFEQNVQGKIADAVNQIEDKTQESLDRISDLEDKANVIEVEKSGETITATDSSDAKFRGMNVCGKSKQVSTTGKNQLDISKIIIGNNLSIEGEKIIVSIPSNSTAVPTNRRLSYLAPNLKVGENYTLTFETTGTSKFIYLENPARIQWNAGQTITITQDMLDSGVLLYASGASTTATITNMMIRDASITDATYEPYTGGKPSPNPEFPQTIENCENTEVSVYGKNLLPKRSDFESIGVTFTTFDDGTVLLNGTATGDVYYNIALDTKLFRFDGTPYTISFGKEFDEMAKINDGKAYMCVAHSLNNALTYPVFDAGGTKTFSMNTVPDTLVVRIRLYAGAVANNVRIYPQIELGTVATEYEPYNKQFLTLNNTLCGISVSSGGDYTDENGQRWVCDYVDFERGVYVHRHAKKVFNGTENWNVQKNGDTYTSFWSDISSIGLAGEAVKSLCTHAPYSFYANNATAIMHHVRSNYVMLSIPNTVASTNEQMKAFALAQYEAGAPITFIYRFATPLETPLTAEQIEAYKALHSNYPNTTIITNNGAGMKVRYGADTKLYIDNKFAELAAQLV